MKKSTRVLVIGPLAPYAAGYRAELDAHGYSPWTAVSYLYSFARLSRWLAAQGLAAGDLDGVCVDRFVADRPGGRVGAVRRATPRGTSSLLGYLQRAGAAPAPAVIGTDVGGREVLVNEFAWFLRTERGLAETTIDWYRHVAAMFLSAQVGDVTDMAVLSARQVNAFVLAQIGRRGTGSLKRLGQTAGPGFRPLARRPGSPTREGASPTLSRGLRGWQRSRRTYQGHSAGRRCQPARPEVAPVIVGDKTFGASRTLHRRPAAERSIAGRTRSCRPDSDQIRSHATQHDRSSWRVDAHTSRSAVC